MRTIFNLYITLSRDMLISPAAAACVLEMPYESGCMPAVAPGGPPQCVGGRDQSLCHASGGGWPPAVPAQIPGAPLGQGYVLTLDTEGLSWGRLLHAMTAVSCIESFDRAARAPCLLACSSFREAARAGVLSQSQVLLAFGVVAELFNGVRDAEPLDGKPLSFAPPAAYRHSVQPD